MLKKYSLKALQTAINHALSLDTNIQTKMQTLEGKVLKITIAPLDVYFYIHFINGKMKLLAHYDDTLVDTFIRSSPLGLIRLSLLPASQARSLFNNKIRLSGDVELGQKVKQLFDELDVDWEGHLAHFTGDVVANQLGSLFRKVTNFKDNFDESMRLNSKEYLQEELRLMPTREELEDFHHDIDALALRVERLQARIDLMDKHETN